MSLTRLKHHCLIAARALLGVVISTALLGLLARTYLTPNTDDIPANMQLLGMQPTNLRTPGAANMLLGEVVFAISPYGSNTSRRAAYAALADYLSRVTNKPIVLQPSTDWLTYQKGMGAGQFDLAFDGAHLASWRITYLNHEPLVRIATKQDFVVIVPKKESAAAQLQDLVGRRICAPSPPNAGTLSLYQHFDRPARRPVLISVDQFKDSYARLIAGACEGAVLPGHVYARLDPTARHTRVLLRTPLMPGETLTAGPRLSKQDKIIIRHALRSPKGQALVRALRSAFDAGDTVFATPQEYIDLHTLLHNTWGFNS